MSASLIGLAFTIIKGGIGWLRGRQEHVDAGQAARVELQSRLAGRGASWMVFVMWAVWMAPLVHAYFDPQAAHQAALALQAVPSYITDTARWLTIFGAGYPLMPKLKK
ncbi:MAG TPA: hypothetical protein VFL97_05185 [Nitrococcus sp.]|nr:hypothetical protein [Nitrococcus sp.]